MDQQLQDERESHLPSTWGCALNSELTSVNQDSRIPAHQGSQCLCSMSSHGKALIHGHESYRTKVAHHDPITFTFATVTSSHNVFRFLNPKFRVSIRLPNICQKERKKENSGQVSQQESESSHRFPLCVSLLSDGIMSSSASVSV